MNRLIFYDTIRQNIFDGKIKQSQVNGIEAILNQWENEKLTDLRWLAYMLATVFHETGATMQPIEEYGKGRGHPYGKPDPITGLKYYGRGQVQLTWKYNYETMGNILGVDLVRHPELALQLDISVKILFQGMIKGFFTGRRLEHYFNYKTDWVNARRIVNGTDRAELIANYAKKFYKALS
jgi:putative chitinase